VARDRQRAKQRKARRAAQNPGPAPTEPHRSDVPGELDHASGAADEFEAALVAGAGGQPADADPEDEEPDEPDEPGAVAAPDAAYAGDDAAYADDDPELLDDEETDLDDDTAAYADEDLEREDEDDEGADEDDRAAAATARRSRRRADAGAPRGESKSGLARFIAFLRASWAELQRVQWPDRRQVAQATAVVLGFVVIAGVYLGIADRIAQEVVDLII
jgi:preprotein translocase subunit SecE